MAHPSLDRFQPKYRFFFQNMCAAEQIQVEYSFITCIEGFVAIVPAYPGAQIGDVITMSDFSGTNTFLNGLYNVTAVNPGNVITDVPCAGGFEIPPTSGGLVFVAGEAPIVPCYPLNWLDASYKWEKERNEIFYRKKMESELSFRDQPEYSITDWTFLYDIYNNYKCCEIRFIVEKWCGGEWIRDFEGYFAHNDGKWNFSECIVTLKFSPIDRYTCLINNSEKEVNILTLDSYESFETLDSLEGEIYIENDLTCTFSMPPTGSNWQPVYTDCPAGIKIWFRPTYLSLYSPNCSQGGGPPSNGVYNWSYESGNCGTGGALYTSPFLLGSLVVQQCSDPPPAPVVGVVFQLVYRDCLNDVEIWAPMSLANTYERGRKLNEAIEYIVSQTCPEIGQVISNFFEINPVDDNPDFPYEPLKNYVIQYTNSEFMENYNETNKWNNIIIHQRSEAMIPPPLNPATIGIMTFSELALMLKTLFNVYWLVDSNNNLRLEHISFFTKSLMYDLTIGDEYIINLGLKSVSFTKEKMPRIERFETTEYADYNFTPKEIIYNSPCILQSLEEKIIYTPGEFITDYEVIMFGSNTNTDGWVLQATTPYTNIMYNEQALFNYDYVNNAPLSWGNLLVFFLRFERVLNQGLMLGYLYEMRSRIKSKKQEKLNMIDCCYNSDFSPETGLIKTEVGLGEVDLATFFILENCFEFIILFDDN